ncbi:LPXTG cell wall anchor domain-containing protein, partial [Aerococcus loyolae]
GGTTPGGDTPGGNTPGGNTPGGDTPGGNTPGGDTPGGNTPGVPNVKQTNHVVVKKTDTPQSARKVVKDKQSVNTKLPQTGAVAGVSTAALTVSVLLGFASLALGSKKKD